MEWTTLIWFSCFFSLFPCEQSIMILGGNLAAVNLDETAATCSGSSWDR